MFCSRCGREIPSTGVCPVCSTMQPPASPAVTATRKCAGSVWVLLASITYSLITVFQLVNYFQNPYNMSEPLSAANLWSTIFMLALSLPILIGLWRLYAAGHSRDGGFSTAGLTLIKAGIIVTIVFCSILAAIGLLATGIGTLRLFSLPRYLAGTEESGLLFLIIGGVFALAFVYYGRLLCSLGLVRRNLTAPVLSHRVSVLVVVINILLALTMLARLLTSLFHIAVPIFLPASRLNLTVTVLNILFLTFFSVALLQYRHRIQALTPVHSTAYPPVYPPAPSNHLPANAVPSPQPTMGRFPTAAAPVMYCRQCGQPVIPGDTVCRHCGSAMN